MRRVLRVLCFFTMCLLLTAPQVLANVVTPDGPWAAKQRDEQGFVIGGESLSYAEWEWYSVGTTASDSTKTINITGKLVGVLFEEIDVDTDCTVKLIDSAGTDVLQGLFVDTEASKIVSADNHYRVPIDDTKGGYIYLINEDVYLDVTSAGAGNRGKVTLIIQNL